MPPPIHALVAVVLFLALWIGLAFELFARLLAHATRSTGRALKTIGVAGDDDLNSALLRLDLLRIVLGVLLFIRFYPELVAARHHTEPSVQIALGSGVLLGGLLAAGIATPFAALALALGRHT